jgi:hypothetical protein
LKRRRTTLLKRRKTGSGDTATTTMARALIWRTRASLHKTQIERLIIKDLQRSNEASILARSTMRVVFRLNRWANRFKSSMSTMSMRKKSKMWYIWIMEVWARLETKYRRPLCIEEKAKTSSKKTSRCSNFAGPPKARRSRRRK